MSGLPITLRMVHAHGDDSTRWSPGQHACGVQPGGEGPGLPAVLVRPRRPWLLTPPVGGANFHAAPAGAVSAGSTAFSAPAAALTRGTMLAPLALDPRCEGRRSHPMTTSMAVSLATSTAARMAAIDALALLAAIAVAVSV